MKNKKVIILTTNVLSSFELSSLQEIKYYWVEEYIRFISVVVFLVEVLLIVLFTFLSIQSVYLSYYFFSCCLLSKYFLCYIFYCYITSGYNCIPLL